MKSDTIEKRSKVHDEMVALFSTPTGQKVLTHLIKTQGVLRPAHTHGNNCCDTAFQDWRRAVVLDMIHFINTDPKYFTDLLDLIEQEKFNG